MEELLMTASCIPTEKGGGGLHVREGMDLETDREGVEDDRLGVNT